MMSPAPFSPAMPSWLRMYWMRRRHTSCRPAGAAGWGLPALKHALDGVEGPLVLHLPDHVAHHLAHLDQVDGLLDEELHPGLIRFCNQLFGRHLGDHHELGPAAQLLQLPHQLDAVPPGHQQIHQHQIRVQRHDPLRVRGPLLAGAAHPAQCAALQDILQHPDHRGVVLRDIDSHFSLFSPFTRWSGSSTEKRAPRPGWLSTETEPPSSSVSDLTAGRPTPRLMLPVSGSNLVE